jgi:hypothetical protein
VARLALSSLVVLVLFAASGTPAAATTYTLGITASGAGAAVVANPPGTLAGCSTSGRCFYRFESGTPVRVTAISSSSGRLARWLGACSGSASTCSLVMDTSKTLIARFTPVLLFADQIPSGFGTVDVTPSGASCGSGCRSYPYGTPVTLAAHASPGFAFQRWIGWCGALSSTDTCRTTLFQNVETSPSFRCTGETCTNSQPLTRDVKVSFVVHGAGKIQFNGISCTSLCSKEYDRGKTIVVRAYGGASFRGWSGNWCRGNAPRCQLTAFRDAFGRRPSVHAYFGS